MQRAGLLNRIYAFLFTAIILFTVSVRDTHYLFTHQHEISEHCENHLHALDAHAGCVICKFDCSIFSASIFDRPFSRPIYIGNSTLPLFQYPITVSELTANYLRGPPTMPV